MSSINQIFESRMVLSLHLLAGLIGLCMLSVPSVAAEEAVLLGPGDTVEAFVLEDQFGNDGKVDADTKVILFSRDMEGGEVIKTALEGKNDAYLADRRVVYVADISGMPGVIARLFALPKMRKRSYPMLLDREGTVTAKLPDQEGHATVIELENLRIVKVDSLKESKDLGARLGGNQ